MRAFAGGPSGRAGGQAGFSLIAAIFLIVVLAALGAFAVQVAMVQYQAANVALLEARAQAAAQAGIGYGATLARTASICTNSRTLNLTQGALAGFVVKVSCAATVHQIYSGAPPSAQNYFAYALSATASFGAYGKPDYVARTATRNVTSAPP
jgi:MSHA biogenesis protein MshP